MFLDQLANGLVLGTIIAITAVGLSLIFGVTGLVNFAHGDLVTLGAVLALVLTIPADVDPGGAGFPFSRPVVSTQTKHDMLWMAFTIVLGGRVPSNFPEIFFEDNGCLITPTLALRGVHFR